MTPVSHGKPYAGNPHVRFEEGASAPANPRRNALLHNGKRDGIQKVLLAGLLAVICLLSASAATNAEVSFKPGAWSTNDWILVKSPRFNYMHGFLQREDGIENECPPVSGE